VQQFAGLGEGIAAREGDEGAQLAERNIHH
jgi:hypothetical protein